MHAADSRLPIPGRRALQAVLRQSTETLARELANPTARAPDWSELEWRIARAAAAIHGVSPLLSDTLRWPGPVGWREFLRDEKEHTAARHQRIEGLLRQLNTHARVAGIPITLLKGVALHARGLYEPGQRPMADVDLLVRTEDIQRTSLMLQSMGFHPTAATWKHLTFADDDTEIPTRLGEQADAGLKIELHDRIHERLPFDTADVSQRMLPPDPRPGSNPYPSDASLMIHLLLHAAGGMASRSLRLLQLHDIAMLSLRMSETAWSEVIGHGKADGGYWWAFPPLRLASRYYSRAIPARVLASLASDCPRRLRMMTRNRTLSDVSFTHLPIEAFPGIEWSHSLAEMLRYAARRLFPDRDTLSLRKYVVTIQAGVLETPWHQLSQSRRIWRWVMSRPARTQTMHAVRVALSQPE